VKEVTLLGQIVNLYGRTEFEKVDGKSPFVQLLEQVHAVDGIERIRFTSPHPIGYRDDLVAAFTYLPKLCPHIHFPMQSGSDRILKLMRRPYKNEKFVEICEKMKAARPGIAITTDIIVGFPGETEEDFAATLSLVREVGFRGLFGFKYSVRPYTPARKLADDVPEDVKSDRLARLFEVSEELLGEHLGKLVGTRQRVLVEGTGKEGSGAWTGRTERNEIVHVAGAQGFDLRGDVVEVEIKRANKHSLQAELTDEARASARPLAVLSTNQASQGRRSLPLVAERAEG